ncbi:uncharacterized protein LOC126847737 [Adelges cooleyi]|uniref:uncharacterized protein LOC126847737 n=1 Tax=Adelges cooleyi TaxID=133065 RepID=UPI002180508B|nr:uncharacterized protein LOC126847737 [Adelges cooleyi]
MRRYIILLVLSVASATATGPGEKPKNDVDDSSLNSLEDVSISCEGSECDGDGDKWTTTKKPHIFQLSSKSCPVFELPSVFPRQLCDTDRQCWPRICCGYGGINGHKYCRIPLPSWRNDLLKSITKKLRSSQPYLQCSPPPPKRYDLFPGNAGRPLTVGRTFVAQKMAITFVDHPNNRYSLPQVDGNSFFGLGNKKTEYSTVGKTAIEAQYFSERHEVHLSNKSSHSA